MQKVLDESQEHARALYIEQLNYHGNDLAELRRLAEIDPDLARKVVDAQERQHARRENSYRLGVIVAGLLAVTIISAGLIVLLELGWWQAVALVLVLLGCSHVLRSLLKGEFSETSWFGKFLSKGTDSES